MVSNQAIALAQQIIDAQKEAEIEKILEGILYCTDIKKGKFKMVNLKDFPILIQGEVKTVEKFNEIIIEFMLKQKAENEKENVEIALLKQENDLLKQQLKNLENKLNQVVDFIDNEGDPFASGELQNTEGGI